MSPIVIFTDGACTGNPGPGGWASILALPDGGVRELGGGERDTTNNRMEMTAAIQALRAIESQTADIILYTDSTYLIKGITQWIWGWRAKGWKNSEGKDVANRDLWEDLARQITRLKPSNIQWKYVRGHAGIPGNERCDQIAVAFSKGFPIELYEGERANYTVDISQIPQGEPLPEKKSSTNGGAGKSSGGTISYLSYLGGVVMRHASWAGCESRVKGQSNAKFRKAKSQQEEREILAAWGLDPATTVIES